MIDILVPVLGRPRNAAPLVESIRESTIFTAHRVTFICSPSDREQLEAAGKVAEDVLIARWEPGPADFAKKVNWAIRETRFPWLMLAADDLRFEEGWAEAALAVAEQTGKRVIATNDKANPEVMRGRHATHPLVARSYIEEYGTIDGEGFYCEAYDHQCVDVEATETAIMRGEFAFAANSVVRHLHPIYNSHVPMDDTYRKALENGSRDRDLMLSRRHLWNPGFRQRARSRRRA